MSAGSVIVIGLGIWMLVVGLVMSLVRVAGDAEPDLELQPVRPPALHLRAMASPDGLLAERRLDAVAWKVDAGSPGDADLETELRRLASELVDARPRRL